jgi:hypothetical protein
MDRFIARENIKHFRDLLWSTVDPGERARVHGLLVEEEDKLGRDLELLAEIEAHIADGNRRIAAQRTRVSTMEQSGHQDVDRARILLDGMTESLGLFARYRAYIADAIQRNRL